MNENQTPAETTKPHIIPKVRDYLQIAVFISILITFAAWALTTWIIPNWEMCFALFTFGLLAWYFYQWRTSKYFIQMGGVQHICLWLVGSNVWSAISCFGKGDSYNILLGCMWIVSALGWAIYSIIASYAKWNYVFQLEISRAPMKEVCEWIGKLSDAIRVQSEAILSLSNSDTMQNNTRKLQQERMDKLILLVAASLDKVADSIATKLTVKKGKVLSDDLFPEELKQLLDESAKTPPDSTIPRIGDGNQVT